jgi:hypothetical protein
MACSWRPSRRRLSEPSVNQLLLCDVPGYAAAGSGARPKPVLTLSELDARFRMWLLDEYHQNVHSETNVAPQARWELPTCW